MADGFGGRVWRRTAAPCLIALIALCVSSPARSQTATAVAWHQGVTLAPGLGGVSDASGTRVAVPVSVGWEVAPQFSVESGVTWLTGGAGASGLATLFGVRATLPPHKAVPFLSGGAGVYRAMFDAAATLPTCYRGRVASDTAGFGGRHVFNDLTYAVGAGADVFFSRHVALRPEASVMLVRVDGRTHPIWVFGSQVAYHVEPHRAR